jgi:hypothetical protein
MGFYPVAVYYNKTQHTNNTHHTNNTPHSNNHSTQNDTNNKEHTTHNEYTPHTMNTHHTQWIQLQCSGSNSNWTDLNNVSILYVMFLCMFIRTEPMYHKNLVLCGNSFMFLTKQNSIN